MKHYCQGQAENPRCSCCQLKDNWQTLEQLPLELARAMKVDMVEIANAQCLTYHYRYFTYVPLFGS